MDSFHALRCRSQAKEDHDQKTMKANIYGLLFMLSVSEFSSTFLHSRLQSDDAHFPTQNSTWCSSWVRVKKKMKREGKVVERVGCSSFGGWVVRALMNG